MTAPLLLLLPSIHLFFFIYLGSDAYITRLQTQNRERGILSERKEGEKKGKRIGATRKVKVKPQNMAREVEEEF